MKEIVKRIMQEMQNMRSSNDASHTKTFLALNEKSDTGYSVECTRSDEECLYDEIGTIVDYKPPIPLVFEIYYVKDGKDIDCITITDFFYDEEDVAEEMTEFTEMWEG